MGRMSRGILGGFAGKVGAVIGSQRNGMDLISSLPKKSNRAATQSQQDQRDKFSLAIGFLQPINTLLKLGFKSSNKRFSSINVAVSQLLKNGITGTSGNYNLNYPKLLISKGELTTSWNVTAVSEVAHEVKLNWSNSTNIGLANEDDQTLVLIYNPAKEQHLMSLYAAIRTDVELILDLPTEYSGDAVHTWIGFISADGKYRSTSVYAGPVTIL
jgi:hypothetical protein